MQIKIKKLHPDAILPTYATDGSACFDIYSLESVCTQQPQAIIKTGLAFEIPEGYALMVYSRSGHAFKSDIRLANCVAVIDSDYRGELLVKLTRDVDAGIHVEYGERVAQGMIIPIEQVGFIEVDELKTTQRGEGGFGSTGK